ncbi:hypothetical protein PENTCL1PPCAC_25017, partial [Pristionchus entomophagus]
RSAGNAPRMKADMAVRKRQQQQQQQQRAAVAATVRAKIGSGSGKRCGGVFQKMGRLVVAIALTVASLVCYLSFPFASDPLLNFASLSEEEKAELRKLEPSVIANLTAHSPYRLGRFCDSGGYCFTIEQRYWKQNGLKAQRFIMYELNDKLALTMAYLKTPEIVTAHHLVHTRWPVDHGRLIFSYNMMQIAAGFALEGLSFNRSASGGGGGSQQQPLQPQRMLQIGMGGGTATGYLASLPMELHLDVVELEPNVYAAAKEWFDFPVSPNINVHIMDGVVFVKEAAAKGVTFDSLILDASSNAPDARIVCPHEVFLQEDVIAAMSKVIGTRGVLSVNLFMPDEQERLQEEVARQFAAHFASCSALVINPGGQKFLLCTNRAVDFDWANQRERILANLAAFDDVVGTNVAPFIDRLNPIQQ